MEVVKLKVFLWFCCFFLSRQSSVMVEIILSFYSDYQSLTSAAPSVSVEELHPCSLLPSLHHLSDLPRVLVC